MSQRHANEHRGGAGQSNGFSAGDDAGRPASSGDAAYYDQHQPAYSGESATSVGPSSRRQVSQSGPASQYPRPQHQHQHHEQPQSQQQQQQQQSRHPPHHHRANAEVPYIPAPTGGHAYLMRNDPPAPHATEEWRSTTHAPQRAGSTGAQRGYTDPYRVPNQRREGRPNFVPRRDENEPPRHFAGNHNRAQRLSEGSATRPHPTSQHPDRHQQYHQQQHQQHSPPQHQLQHGHHHHHQQPQQQGLHELARHMGDLRSQSKDGSARGRGSRGAKRGTPSSTTGSSAPITPEQRPAQPSGSHARRLGKIGTPPAAAGDSSASDSASGPPKPRPDMSGRRLAQLDHDFGEDKRLVLSVLKEKARNMGLAEASGRPGGGEEAEESHRTQQRRKQILFGKVTTGYRRYVANVPPFLRHRGNAFHAATPRADVKCSKRRWDLLMQIWRRELHLWDADQFDAVDEAERARMLAGVDDAVTRDGVRFLAVDGAAVECPDAALVDYRRQLQSALDRVARSVEGTFKTGAAATGDGSAPTTSPPPMSPASSTADADEPIAALDALERAQWSLRTVPECVQSPTINLVPSAATTPGAAGTSPMESPSANGLSAPPDTAASTPRVDATTDVPSSVSSNSPHADDTAAAPTPPPSVKTPVSRRRPEPLNAADSSSAAAGNYSMGAPLPSPAREAANGPPLSGRPIALILSGQVHEKQVKTGGPMAFRVDTPDGGTPQEVFRELEATFHVSNLSFHVMPGSAPLPPPMSAPQPVPKPFVSPTKSNAPPEPSEHTATPARTNLDVSETLSGGTPTSGGAAVPQDGRAGTLPPTADTSDQDTPSPTSPQTAFVDGVSDTTSARDTPIASDALPVGQRTPEQHSRGVPAAAVRPCVPAPAPNMGLRRSSFADEDMQPQRSPPIAGSVGRLERSRSGNPNMSPVGSPGTVRPSVFSADSKMPSAPIVVGRHGAKPGRNHEHLPVPEMAACALHPDHPQCTVYRLNRVQNVAYFLSFYETGLPLVYLDNGEGEGSFKTNGGPYKQSLDYWRSVTPLLPELQDASSHAPDLAFRNTVSPDAFTGILGSTPMAPDGRTDVNRFWTQTPGKTPVHVLRGDTQTPQELNNSLRDVRPHSRSSPSGPAGRAMRHTPGHNERFSQDRDESVARHTTRSAVQSPKGSRDDEHNGAPSPAGIEVANAVRR